MILSLYLNPFYIFFIIIYIFSTNFLSIVRLIKNFQLLFIFITNKKKNFKYLIKICVKENSFNLYMVSFFLYILRVLTDLFLFLYTFRFKPLIQELVETFSIYMFKYLNHIYVYKKNGFCGISKAFK